MRDPALAYELMQHINSQAFGLSVETGSFRHAIMMIGYQELADGWRCNSPRQATTTT